MVFDEYDYLEKTVESLKDRTRNELDRDSKPSGTEMEYPRDAFRHRERSPSRLRETSSSRYWEPSSSRHREPSSSRILEGSSSRHRSSLDYRSWDGDRELHHSGRDNRDDRVRDWDRDHSGRDNRDDRVRDWDREREKAKERERLERERLEKEKENERLERDNRDDWVRDWDREREKAKERERLERDRLEKENEKERERLEKEKEKENEKEREREKEKEKERERERERERSRRSRSHSERHREEERERERREKSRELRERESDRESRRFKESKEVAEPEADPERDQRTVFAFQITLKADERDVYDFFSRAGKVRDVRLIMDRNSRRSKGVGYIEFYDALSVPMAIALSGQLLLGQPVMVKPSEAEKNLVQSNTTIGGANGLGPYSGGARRLYVGNLHFNMTEEQLRLVFEPFGPVEMVQLPRDLVTGFCKGYGFIQFQRLEDARAAIHLNGQLEIAGRSIKVSAVTDQVGLPEVGANTGGDLDDDEGGGLSLNACSRALLMQKLDRTGTVTSIPGVLLPPVGNAPVLTPAAPVLAVAPPVLGVPRAVSPLTPAAPVLVVPRAVSPILLAPAIVPPVVPATVQSPVVPATAQPPVVPATAQLVDNVGIPSECLLLKNMFDPTVETEPDFDLDIKEDAEVECAKHGTVKHIFVDKNSAGHVYLRFDSTSSAMSAQRALNGRWFAGNTITAIFLTPQNYEARFPSSS